jgi:oligoendopeptidase F
VVYFGNGYDTPITVSHEFGHYMNEIYNKSEYNQSYDLLETHSQAHEMLFIYYAKDYLSATGYRLAETYQMYATLSSVITALRVDAFEQAIYLDSYDGYFASKIMADNTITSDEYDLLYESIGKDFGLHDGADDLNYWRYGMTISSPCYYVSYSVSAINALQIYSKIFSDGFDAAKDSYLKLFTYTDVDPDMTMDEVLEYAGLVSYKDEALYQSLSEFFENK